MLLLLVSFPMWRLTNKKVTEHTFYRFGFIGRDYGKAGGTAGTLRQL